VWVARYITGVIQSIRVIRLAPIRAFIRSIWFTAADIRASMVYSQVSIAVVVVSKYIPVSSIFIFFSPPLDSWYFDYSHSSVAFVDCFLVCVEFLLDAVVAFP
jgi:hypothetical protein